MACAFLLVAAQGSSLARGPQAGPTPQPQTPKYVPPTQADRNRDYLRSLVNPVGVVAAAAGSGISQWRNTPHEWKQGGAAYGLRFVNSYGYNVVRETLMFGASSLLGEDNRYLPSPRPGGKTRLWYAIESTFLSRREDGSRRFSYSRIGATLGTGFLSRTWQPSSSRTPQNAASFFGISMAVQVGFHVAHEFVPFMRKRR